MSRGPGRIMREVRRLLEAEPDRLWTIEKLARAIYGEAQKRHRVSVGRALPRVAKEIDWACVTYRGFHRGPPPLVWYNRRSFAAWRETHPYAPEEKMRAMFERDQKRLDGTAAERHAAEIGDLKEQIEWHRKMASFAKDPKEARARIVAPLEAELEALKARAPEPEAVE